ncbi:MAG: peptidoglycan DD-metalloendopeptidase family protein [Pseudomonadota bacterium]|nr:peptidoglycan DD-metalloendopeptidase family protein [Pseudomonadota bacterium]
MANSGRIRRWITGLYRPAGLIGLFALVSVGCSTALNWPDSPGRPPAHQGPRPEYHTVQSGETLYAIAWYYQLDARDLAAWNSLHNPDLIYIGQRLRLSRPSASSTTRPSSPKAKASSKSASGSTSVAASSPVWRWPAQGQVVERFSQGRGNKGIDIAGKGGSAVSAAADGRVVYSGSGLIGYGQLIIVKHNNHFLSAYAYNRKLYVEEGDKVVAGQLIAEMGLGNNQQPILHFEIRVDGAPVDPLRYLPAR